MKVREMTVLDTDKFTSLTKEIENTSEYMLWEPGERTIDSVEQRKRIENIVHDKNSTIFVAEENDELVGFLMAIGGSANRAKYTVYLVVGILKEYRGMGVGTSLFNALEQWAIKNTIHRLELTVVVRNQAGVSLYEKMGFEVEGLKRDSLFIDGEFVDEYYMAKIL